MAEQDAPGGSARPDHRAAFSETTWDRISEPGAYVEKGSGDLYRIPREALGPGSPLIMKQSLGASRIVKISSDPFIITAEARMLCAEGNLRANF